MMKHIDVDHTENHNLLSIAVYALYEPAEDKQGRAPSKHPIEVTVGYVSAPKLAQEFYRQGLEPSQFRMNTLGELLAKCISDKTHWAEPGDQQKAIDWLLADGCFTFRRNRVAWFHALQQALRDAGSYHPLIESIGAHLEAIGYHNLVLEGFDADI